MSTKPGTAGTLSKLFGVNTFNRKAMQEKLPRSVFESLSATIETGQKMDPAIVPAVAHAMKEWAMERGATHYCHWFHPMTGATAEKHDAFLTFDKEHQPIEHFSASQLAQGEPDASSFPSGGMRTTFEARGYTAWDPSSPAFLIEGPQGATLCIPSVFLSYHGEALDKKTPLLRSIDALSRAAVRLLGLLGVRTARVMPQVGCEQEYFLVERGLYELRPDLMVCGRTLLGARPAKGQQMEDHYFGSIPQRMLAFMQDAEMELIKLGVPVKTRHNEVAPHQFETAPIFEEVNLASDHNQLVMEILRRVASRHSLALLIHEKPFDGINGSGKHNNWSLSTAEGQNLFEPGQTPHENVQFLLFLAATLKAVHQRAGLLRCSIASAGNDLRLGANEAPPAIISVFLGRQLSDILDQIESGAVRGRTEQEILDLGVSTLPAISRDNTDRNRTSPFAFTGNKFEFRAVPSALAISLPQTALNVAMAEALDEISDKLQARLDGAESSDRAAFDVIREEIAATRAIRFEGDNYSQEWRDEAERRALPNARNTPEALRAWLDGSNQALLKKYAVFNDAEIHSRHHIFLEEYIKLIDIEAATLAGLVRQYVLPACLQYQGQVADSVGKLQFVDSAAVDVQKELLRSLSDDVSELIRSVGKLEAELRAVREEQDHEKRAERSARDLLENMGSVRAVADRLEGMTDHALWPLPTYLDLLFRH
jgi:glutamine synthetase